MLTFVPLPHSTNSIAGGMWPASHVTSECIDHFLAGTETTSTSLAYTLYHLALHPDIMKKLQEELDSCVPANTVPGLQETARFPYLNAVIKESKSRISHLDSSNAVSLTATLIPA